MNAAASRPDLGDVEARIAELEERWHGVVVAPAARAGDENTNGCTYGCTHGCTNTCTGVCALAGVLGEDVVPA